MTSLLWFIFGVCVGAFAVAMAVAWILKPFDIARGND